MESKHTWRTRVKKLRAKLGRTQEEFAELIGVSRITVIRWEKKRNNLSVHVAAKREIERLEKIRKSPWWNF